MIWQKLQGVTGGTTAGHLYAEVLKYKEGA